MVNREKPHSRETKSFENTRMPGLSIFLRGPEMDVYLSSEFHPSVRPALIMSKERLSVQNYTLPQDALIGVAACQK
jgi:hypothetical protein